MPGEANPSATPDPLEVEVVAEAYVNSRTFWPVTWRFMKRPKKDAIRRSIGDAIRALDTYRASKGADR